MATDLTTQTSTTGRPSILSQAARERISLTFSRIADVGGRFEIIEANAPTPAERQAMRGRLTDLANSMRPADAKEIEMNVGSLLAGYPAGRAHKDDADRVMAMFIQALRDLPAWAIRAACSAWNRGEYPGWRAGYSPAPSPSDLRGLALAATEQFDRERQQIKAVLAAEVVPEPESDEKRAEVAARIKQWVRDRDPNAESNRKLTEEECDARIAETMRKVRTETAPLSSLAKHAAGLIDTAIDRRAEPDMDEPGRRFPIEQDMPTDER